MRRQLSNVLSRVLRSQTLRAARGFVACIIALAMMLTTCVGAQAEETDNASDSNVSVAPLETAETSGESETPVATESEASTEPELAAKAAEPFNIDDWGLKITDVDGKAHTFNTTIALTDASNTYALSLVKNSNGRYALGSQKVANLSAEDTTWQWSTIQNGDPDYLVRIWNPETGYYLTGGANADLGVTKDREQAILMNLDHEKSQIFTWQNQSSGWQSIEFRNGKFHTANHWDGVLTNVYVKGLEPPAPKEYVVKTDTVSPKNTTVNLFDFWIGNGGRNQATPANWNDPSAANFNANQGINNNHALKFVAHSGDSNGLGAMNQYTGSAAPRSGIVKPNLANGYPMLASNSESLEYLFNPKVSANGKQSFADTKGLLSVDADGYYYYDSRRNYAYFNEKDKSANQFTVYEQPIACATSADGQFFPFTSTAAMDANTNCQAGDLNHFFGLTLTSSFTQRYGGHVSAGGAETTFQFEGDDDVWVFIDGVLVADLGGIHQRSTVDINFASGAIKINGKQVSTVREQFVKAGRGDAYAWNNNTFPNNTEHVFNFFYLERGADLSNMTIKYNFEELPEYSITKVDQYGNPVPNARFGIYKGTQEETTDEGSATAYKSCYVNVSGACEAIPANAVVDPHSGVITVGGTEWARPAFVGVTDKSGILPFVDATGTFYSAADIIQAVGTEFLLREIQIPEGYRTVSEDALLRFQGDAEHPSSLILTSPYPFHSGVWSSLSSTVTANQVLHGVDKTKPSNMTLPGGSAYPDINYYSANGKENGTLFAVVQHRHINEKWTSINDMSSWHAIYGDDATGYQEQESGDKASTIAAGKMQYTDHGGRNVFTKRGTVMQAKLRSLPGDPTHYYSFVEQRYFGGDSAGISDLLANCQANSTDNSQRFRNCTYGKDNYTVEQLEALDSVRYGVTYYWTSGSIEEADENNTVRVRSHSVVTADTKSGFGIQWGAEVLIPNIENRLFFQNFIYKDLPSQTDGQDGNLAWKDSTFALYRVGESADSVIYYHADDGSLIYLESDPKKDGKLTGAAYVVDGNGKKISGEGTYEIKTDNGVVDVTIDGESYMISPAKNAAGDPCFKQAVAPDVNNPETNVEHFSRLRAGRYVLRQITAPLVPVVIDAGTGKVKYDSNGTPVKYAINIEEALVNVTDGRIYANAGTDRDGVAVGNGPGYVVKTLNQFASQSVLDETLSWISAVLRTDNTSHTFADFEGFLSGVGDGNLVTPGTAWNSNTSFGMSSWLAKDEDGNVTGSVDTGALDSKDMAISGAQTNTLSQAMVTYLQYQPGRQDASFDYYPTSNQEPRAQGGTAKRSASASGAASGDSAGGQLAFDKLAHGENRARLYTDTGWSMLNIWQDYAYGSGQQREHVNTDYENLRSQPLTSLFSNSTFVAFYNAPPELPKIVKVEAGTDKWTDAVLNEHGEYSCEGINNLRTLEDGGAQCSTGYGKTLQNAQFTISKDGGDSALYRSKDGSWTADPSEAAVFKSDENGMLVDALLWVIDESVYGADRKSIKYTIKEVGAPAGYEVVNPAITFWMYNKDVDENGNVSGAGVTTYIAVESGTRGVKVSQDNRTLYVENAPGVELPATGATSGHWWLMLGLLALGMGGVVYWAIRRRLAR